MSESPKTAKQQIEDALRERGYRPTWHATSGHNTTIVLDAWVGPEAIYILRTWPDGGVELFGEVDRTNSTQATIDAILDGRTVQS